MKILGIETSCDETAAAVIQGQKNKITVLSNIISSQINLHKKYGGVVPEVAAREHVLQILPVINEALEKTQIKRQQASKKIKAIAVVTGPGLITSLQVGIETAKVLSYVWHLPVCAINHIEGHIYANFIDNRNIKLPAIILTASGGHTILALMKEHNRYQTIGETRDDAAGEAFDKAAKLLGLGYPGGPAIATEADKFIKQHPKISNYKLRITKIKLPRPMIKANNLDFSFSGLKTALLYELKKEKNWQKRIPAYAYEFQQAIIDILIGKTSKAIQKHQAKTIMLAGGVSANHELRRQITEYFKTKLPRIKFLIPDLKYTTDNAAMIATAGYFKALRKEFIPWQKLKADCNLEL